MAHEISAEMRQCIQKCLGCEQACSFMVPHCLHKGGRHADGAHIGLLLDCAAVCATSAQLMMRGSKHHARMCAVCADVCEACARDCESFRDDPEMQRCAEACRQCADSCREMAGVVMP
jgi:hypothetical protein